MNKKGDPPLAPRKAPDFPVAMLAFWDAYDAKGRERSSRSQVSDEWKRLRPDTAIIAEIMDGVAAWTASQSWQDGFAPGAHRFLKLGKWRERPATNGGTRHAPPDVKRPAVYASGEEQLAAYNQVRWAAGSRRGKPKEPSS